MARGRTDDGGNGLRLAFDAHRDGAALFHYNFFDGRLKPNRVVEIFRQFPAQNADAAIWINVPDARLFGHLAAVTASHSAAGDAAGNFQKKCSRHATRNAVGNGRS